MSSQSNKELLKLENEYRNVLPKYKAKPDIKPIGRPAFLTQRVSEFLDKSSKPSGEPLSRSTTGETPHVEMEIYVDPKCYTSDK